MQRGSAVSVPAPRRGTRVKGGRSLSQKRTAPFIFPKRKARIGSLDLEGVRCLWNDSACVAALLRSPPWVRARRLAVTSTTRCCAAVGGFAALRMRHTPCGCRSAYWVLVRTNFLLSIMQLFPTVRTAASEAMPPRQAPARPIISKVDSDRVRLPNRRQSGSG